MTSSEAHPSAPGAASRLRVGVLSGSPRRGGSCAHLAGDVVAPTLAQAGEGLAVEVRELARFRVAPCLGCGVCERTGVCVLARGEGAQAAESEGRAPGFAGLLAWLDSLDALVLVAPVYFAGPPAQLKALLDRMQFLWARRYLLGRWPRLTPQERRPCGLVVVGSGGDPFGCEPLVTCCTSALRMANFELASTERLVGYRSGRPGAEPDETFERCATDFARAFATECARRGPYAMRGAIDPLRLA